MCENVDNETTNRGVSTSDDKAFMQFHDSMQPNNFALPQYSIPHGKQQACTPDLSKNKYSML